MCPQIAPMEVGRINIEYRRVECTPPEPLMVSVNFNYGPGAWLRIVVSVRDHGLLPSICVPVACAPPPPEPPRACPLAARLRACQSAHVSCPAAAAMSDDEASPTQTLPGARCMARLWHAAAD